MTPVIQYQVTGCASFPSILYPTWHFSPMNKTIGFCSHGGKVCLKTAVIYILEFLSITVVWHYKYVCDPSIIWTENLYYNIMQYNNLHKLWTCLFHCQSSYTLQQHLLFVLSTLFLHFLPHIFQLSYIHSFGLYCYCSHYFYLHV